MKVSLTKNILSGLKQVEIFPETKPGLPDLVFIINVDYNLGVLKLQTIKFLFSPNLL